MKEKFLNDLTEMINVIENRAITTELDKKKKIIKQKNQKIHRKRIEHYRQLLNNYKQNLQKIRAQKDELQIQLTLIEKQNKMFYKREDLLQQCLLYLQEEKNSFQKKLEQTEIIYNSNFNNIAQKLQNQQNLENELQYKIQYYEVCFQQIKQYFQKPNSILQNFQNTLLTQNNLLTELNSQQIQFDSYFEQYQQMQKTLKDEIEKKNIHQQTRLQNDIQSSENYQNLQKFFIQKSFQNFLDYKDQAINQSNDLSYENLLNLKNLYESLISQNEIENQQIRLQNKIDRLKKICQNLIYENGSFRKVIMKLRPQQNIQDLFLKEDFVINQTLAQKDIYQDIGQYIEKLFGTKVYFQKQTNDQPKQQMGLQNKIDLQSQQLQIRDQELDLLREENLELQQENSNLGLQIQNNELKIDELQNIVDNQKQLLSKNQQNNTQIQPINTNKIEQTFQKEHQKLQNSIQNMQNNLKQIQTLHIQINIENQKEFSIQEFQNLFNDQLKDILENIKESNEYQKQETKNIILKQLYGSFPLYYINKLIQENNEFRDLRNVLKQNNQEFIILELQKDNKKLQFELNKIQREKQLVRQYLQKKEQGEIIENSELLQELEYQNQLIAKQIQNIEDNTKLIEEQNDKIKNLENKLSENNENLLITKQYNKILQETIQQQKRIHNIRQQNQNENKKFLRKQLLTLLKLNVFQKETRKRLFKYQQNTIKYRTERLIL